MGDKESSSEEIIGAMTSLNHETKTKIRAGSKELWVQVGAHQGSEASPLIFAIAMDVIIEYARKGLINEMLKADDLVVIKVWKI